MSKIDNVYEEYLNNITRRFVGTLPKGNNIEINPPYLEKNEFIDMILTNDLFNNEYGKDCTVELTEEEKLVSPPGHKRKLID